ncbi:MAG: CAP domain-containing protein [Actinobacteria bacterium]|nr:CAP domain-containing protein [Actinomycetota bacterium]
MSHAVLTSPHRRVRLLLAALVLALVTTVIQLPAAPANAHTGGHTDIEQQFLRKINNARENWCTKQGRRPRCINPLKMASDGYRMRDRAQAWSHTMALKGTIWHDPTNSDVFSAWGYAWGENVGKGTSVKGIHRQLMESDCHRVNILSKENPCPILINGQAMNRDWTTVAIGVEKRTLSDGFRYIFVTQIFFR